MRPVYEFMFLLFSISNMLLLVLSGGDENKYQGGDCPASFSCGYLGRNISFPFTTTQRQDCGYLPIHNCDDPQKSKTILGNEGEQFEVEGLVPLESHRWNGVIRDTNLYELLQNRSCDAFRHNYTLLPTFGFLSFQIAIHATMFMCNRSIRVSPPAYMHNYTKCPHYDLYYQPHIFSDNASRSAFRACTNVQLPIKDLADANDPFTFVTADILTIVSITEECAYCHYIQRGRCQHDSNGRFYCANGILKPDTLDGNTSTDKCTAII